MEGTPKILRKNSLSLARFRRGQASSQDRVRSTNIPKAAGKDNATFSPSASDNLDHRMKAENEKYTPPHKKCNHIDDSLDYSPTPFDLSISPRCLLSQTMTIDSPEVSWRWGEVTSSVGDTTSGTPTHDADSGFISAGSSSTESAGIRTRIDGNRQRLLYDLRREEKRRALDLEIRRAEKARADELLKQRCAKLKEQLNGAEKQRQQKENLAAVNANANKLRDEFDKLEKKVLTNAECEKNVITPTVQQTTATTDPFDDFFNDSESDGLLLAATQQFESKIFELTQKTTAEESASTSKPTATATATATATTSPATKEKRSSLYMKFLEDDSPDDWFLSLDDVIQQAEQQKPRTSLQRYNSMPAKVTTTKALETRNTTHTTTLTTSTMCNGRSYGSNKSCTGATSKMKRHASTYSLNPSSASYK